MTRRRAEPKEAGPGGRPPPGGMRLRCGRSALSAIGALVLVVAFLGGALAVVLGIGSLAPASPEAAAALEEIGPALMVFFGLVALAVMGLIVAAVLIATHLVLRRRGERGLGEAIRLAAERLGRNASS